LVCQAHLGEVKTFKGEFERRGVAIVVVSFVDPSKLVQYQQRHQWPFAILTDPQRTAYRAFSLKRLPWFQVFSPATLARYWRFFSEGMKREDYGKEDIHQSGGDFVLDREGNILFAHRSQDPADRPSVADLLREIDGVKSHPTISVSDIPA
jgi:peroxiredoxin